MGEVVKPFACPVLNCGMSFTNEDHLEVHRRQHEIQLTINDPDSIQAKFLCTGTGTGKIICKYLVDQTTTPTRFLKHCDEVSLLHDIGLNLNPFDLEFRKASNYQNQLNVSETPGTSDSLETPRILPLADSDETISSTSRDDVNNAALQPSSLQKVCSTSTISASISLNSLGPSINEEIDNESRERKKLTLDVSSATDIAQGSNVLSTPTPVITAGPSIAQSLSSSALNTPNIVASTIPNITVNGSDLELNTPTISPCIRLPSTPTSVLTHSNCRYYDSSSNIQNNLMEHIPATVEFANTDAVVPSVSSSQDSTRKSSTSATVLQLVLRLPNWQSIPVEIPASPLVSTRSTPIETPSKPSVTSIAPLQSTTPCSTTNSSTPIKSLAKMKLKEALASSSTAARPGETKHSRATTADRIAEMTRNRNKSGTSSNGDDYLDDSNSSCSSGTNNNTTVANNCSKIGRRRRNTDYDTDESTDQKRAKFLERNRAAAVKCREKKKRLVQVMAEKSVELGIVNQRLQSEVSSLRSEVASLKSLLLRHKNCPVTLAMNEDDSCYGSRVPQMCTTFRVEDPAGVITEVTTTPINYCPPQAQPPSFSPKSSAIPFVPEIPRPIYISKNSVSPSKIRKRSLSLSAIMTTQSNTINRFNTLEEEEVISRAVEQVFKLSNGSLVYCSNLSPNWNNPKPIEPIMNTFVSKPISDSISIKPTIQNLEKIDSCITKVTRRNLGPTSKISIRPHPIAVKSEPLYAAPISVLSHSKDTGTFNNARTFPIRQPAIVSTRRDVVQRNSSKILLSQKINSKLAAKTRRTANDKL